MLTDGPTDEEASIISAHFEYLTSLTKQGTMLVFGRTQNNDASTFGLCIFRANSDLEASAVVNNDPAVKAGVMRAKMFPYKVAGLNAAGWQQD